MPSDAPEAGMGVTDDPVPGWVRAASNGDAQAWDRLVDRYAGLVWSVCRAHRKVCPTKIRPSPSC
jgi:DNA-directed RNA polymerase specialized sigma subunit